MRGKLFGIAVMLVLSSERISIAQTPTGGPSPTPTPPPPIYISDPEIVNTSTSGNQRRASVAFGADDNYLIVWNSDAAQAGFSDIKGQLFTRDGVKIGGEFQVDQAGANRLEYTPHVASDGAGYVVVWADFNSAVTDSEIWMRRYDGAANPLAAAVQVNAYTTGQQRLPRVATDSAGQFVVVWESQGQDGNGLGIVARRYDETGAPVGVEFVVNSYTTGDQGRASIDMDDSGFTVVFNDGNTGVAAVEFGSFAQAGTPQFQVFGPNHRFAEVARLDGAASTFFVAENTVTQAIDGVRSENGSAQTPFTTVSRGFNPRLARRHPVSSLASQPTGGVGSEAWLAWERDLYLYGQKYGVDVDGILFEEYEFRWWLLTIPDIDVSPYGAVAAAGQTGTSPGTDVEHGHAAVPNPVALAIFDDNANGVLEPNEQGGLSGFEEFFGPAPLTLDGIISQPPGLAPQTLTITDATADYGTIQPGGTADCQATGDCYGVTISGSRPGVHWDESFVETLSNDVHKTWLAHIGESFADVPTTNLFYAFIENLLHNGVTAGGACGGYCPTDGVKRQQMAVFLLKSRFGPSFTPPPATGTIFTDVTLANPFANWIEALFLLGITGGCSGGPPPAPTQFCPDAIVNRQQMAVFLLKTFEGSAYLPPAATGIFQDVLPANPFRDWIEELYNRQVTGGCVTVPLQYCPANPTNRQQMAAFLVKTFGLLLYGP